MGFFLEISCCMFNLLFVLTENIAVRLRLSCDHWIYLRRVSFELKKFCTKISWAVQCIVSFEFGTWCQFCWNSCWVRINLSELEVMCIYLSDSCQMFFRFALMVPLVNELSKKFSLSIHCKTFVIVQKLQRRLNGSTLLALQYYCDVLLTNSLYMLRLRVPKNISSSNSSSRAIFGHFIHLSF